MAYLSKSAAFRAVFHYEVRLMLRSWLLRIFAILSLLILTFFNFVFFSGLVPSPHAFRALPSYVPYLNLIFVNLGQLAVIAILATETYRRDRKFNTAEVILIRSMPNLVYLLAKAGAIWAIFLGLDLLLLVIGFIVQVFISDMGLDLWAYLRFILIIPLPGLVFVTGMAFLLMRLARVQAIAVLLILGYLAVGLFYLQGKGDLLFDVSGLQQPLNYSHFLPMLNEATIAMQRLIYVLAGLAMMLLSVITFERLPQALVLNRLLGVTAVLLLAASIATALAYRQPFIEDRALRSEMRRLDGQLLDRETPQVRRHEISLRHLGYRLEADSRMVIANQGRQPLDSMFLCLNPGLAVSALRINDHEQSFRREAHIVRFSFARPLTPGDSLTLQLAYSGEIDEAAAYTDIDEEMRRKAFHVFMYNIDKRAAIVTPDYLLLTPEINWYPVAQLPLSSRFPHNVDRSFTHFILNVHSKPHLTALSQGAPSANAEGNHRFAPAFPLNGISLVAGTYEKRSVAVDGVDYNLYHHPGHLFFDSFFSNIGDTLAAVIREARQDYERKLELDYPFDRLDIIEAPAVFHTYRRTWTVATDVVQPMQVLLNENGCLGNGFSFTEMQDRFGWRDDRNNQTLTDLDKEIRLFKRMVQYTFTGETPGWRRNDGDMSYKPDYNLFPTYYRHVNAFSSRTWPLYDVALEGFLFARVDNPTGFSFFSRAGLTEEEQVSQAIYRDGIMEVIERHQDAPQFVSTAIRLQGERRFNMLQSQLAEGQLSTALRRVILENRFRLARDSLLQEALGEIASDSVQLPWATNYGERDLPAYRVSDVKLHKVLDVNRVRYRVALKIENVEPVPGVVELTFRAGGRRGGRGGGSGGDSDFLPRVIYLGGNEIRDISLLLDDEPRRIMVNFIMAKNLPLQFSYRFRKAEVDRRVKAEEHSTRIVSVAQVDSNEIVVDNTDREFQVQNPPYASWLKRLLMGDVTREETYEALRMWRPPNRWGLTKNTEFYGDYIKSAYYIKSGSDTKKATWDVRLRAAGDYDIFTYFFDKRAVGGRWWGDQSWGDYQYTVYHADGIEEIPVNMDAAEEGWNYLGTFFFSDSIARVELSDQSSGRVVVADAIRFVKR